VSLHAGLDAAATRLDTGTSPLDIGFADFDHSHIAHESSLAGFGKLGEMLLDARSDPAVARLDPAADVKAAAPIIFATTFLWLLFFRYPG
jgi:hypothetical protein